MNTYHSTPEAISVVEAFFQSHDAAHFAENGEWQDNALKVTAHGRSEIATMLGHWYPGNCCDAYDEPLNMIMTDDTVVAEWIYHSAVADKTHEITVPIVALFEVYDRIIQRIRLYYDPTQRAGFYAKADASDRPPTA